MAEKPPITQQSGWSDASRPAYPISGAKTPIKSKEDLSMDFFTEAVDILGYLVIALGAGLCVWGGINLLEGYGGDNRATRS